MTTPTTDARERAEKEAREMVYEGLLSYYWPHDTNSGDKGSEEAFARARQAANGDADAYRAAILATERARVLAVVEGERREPEKRVAVNIAIARAHNAASNAILQRLDAERTP